MKTNLFSNLKAYALWSVVLLILFPVIYGTTNMLGVHAVQTFRFAHNSEVSIPFIPAAITVYMTLQILFLLPAFILNACMIHGLGKALTSALLAAAPIFYFFPAPTLYERKIPEGFWHPVYRFLFSIDANFNTFPSLHVTFSFILIAFLNQQLKSPYFLWTWFTLICVSVLLTHQHHVADILGGIILGYAACAIFLKQNQSVIQTEI